MNGKKLDGQYFESKIKWKEEKVTYVNTNTFQSKKYDDDDDDDNHSYKNRLDFYIEKKMINNR